MSIELKRMTPSRAAYFMERFKREEKLLGPNEQAALTYVIDMLEKATAIKQAEAQQPDSPSLQAVCRYISDVLGSEAPNGEKHIARTIMHLLPLEQSLSGQQPVTGEPVKGLLRDMQAIADGAIKIPAREFAMHALAEFGTHPAPSVPNGWRRASDLPPPGQPVIAWVDGVKVPIRAFWVPDFHLEPGDDFDTEWAKYSEEHDTFFCPSGWYESNHYEETNWQVEKPVLAWMPLPAIDAAMLAAAQAQKGGA